MKVVADFKALKLSEQHQAFPEIQAAYSAAKDARRQELEKEIRELGFAPGEVRKAPAAVKYRSKKNPSLTYSGRGAVAAWLKAEMEESNLPLEAFRV